MEAHPWAAQLQVAFPDTVFGPHPRYPAAVRAHQEMGVRSRSVEIVVARAVHHADELVPTLRAIVADPERHGELWSGDSGRALVLLSDGAPPPAVVPDAKRFCARFSSAWTNGVLVVQGAGAADNPHLPEVALASALSSWSARNHRHEGARPVDAPAEAWGCIGTLLREEHAAHRAAGAELAELEHGARQIVACATRLRQRCDDRGEELHSAARYVAQNVDVDLASVAGTAGTLSAQQTALVESALLHLAQPGARLRSEDVNKGTVAGLAKYTIDKHFGTFTAFRKAVGRRQEAEALASAEEAPEAPEAPETTDEK